jgi:ribosomal protein S18 acetylase RimI-like enzyme
MEILLATMDNAKDVANIEFNNGYVWSKYSLEEEIKFATSLLNSEKVFLAKKDNSYVGYISIKIENNIGEIGMSVLENYQGKGIGSRLVLHILDFAKKTRCKKIKLEVWEKNKKAITLYKKFDFSVIAEKKNFYKNGDSLLTMALNLKK